MLALAETYDEFRDEYDYHKDYYGIEIVKIMKRNRDKGRDNRPFVYD